VYSLTYPNGDGFPLLIFFLCTAYRHHLTFAKWHLRGCVMNLSNVLWANKETVLSVLLRFCAAFFRSRELEMRSASRRFQCLAG
jgi:hypothetical protein